MKLASLPWSLSSRTSAKYTLSSETIRSEAALLGFSACGMAPAAPVSAERAAEYETWIAEGRHAGMDYLARNVEKKLNPKLLVEGARTVVSLAVNYYTPLESDLPSFSQAQSLKADENGENRWTLGRYALGTDYHEVVKGMLRKLMEALHLEEGVDGRCFVDTAPIDEKYWAVACGLGWRGRNSQLIIPGAGSYFFLGELVLVHEVDHYDHPMKPHCGSCHRCVNACPAGALYADGLLDARKCLSYLTIEHRGPLPEGTGTLMGRCFYGCERCASVCPWNRRFASPTQVEALMPRQSILDMNAEDWRNLTIERYRELFRKSAVKRAKYEGLMRNIHEMDEAQGGATLSDEP